MSHEKLIWDHILTHGSITTLEAFTLYGCLRLSARIYDLRRMGKEITATLERMPSGKYVAVYRSMLVDIAENIGGQGLAERIKNEIK